MESFATILRTFIAATLTSATLAVTTCAVQAETWPSRPIKIIVPFAAGGAVDIVARLLQDEMGKALGTTVVVENRGGGAGVPASEALVRAAPDGYTIALMASNYVSNAIMQPQLSFDTLKDITPITMVIINTVMVLVPADSSIKTLAELVAQAKAQPGKLSYASAGNATAMHFAGELLKARAGIDLVHVPYRGAGPALNDLLGKQVPIAIIGVGPAMPFIESGKIRALAITTEKRSKKLPNVPTVAEAGYPGYRFGEWFAMIAPKGLSPEIRDRLRDAIIKAANTPSVKEQIEKAGLEVTQSTPEELGNFLASETERIRVIANDAKMLQKKN